MTAGRSISAAQATTNGDQRALAPEFAAYVRARVNATEPFAVSPIKLRDERNAVTKRLGERMRGVMEEQFRDWSEMPNFSTIFDGLLGGRGMSSSAYSEKPQETLGKALFRLGEIRGMLAEDICDMAGNKAFLGKDGKPIDLTQEPLQMLERAAQSIADGIIKNTALAPIPAMRKEASLQ